MSSDAPSKAAKELAKLIDVDWDLVPDNGFHFADTVSAQEKMLREARNDAIEQVAGTIQSALADMLEKAETLYCRFGGHAPSHGCSCNNCELAKAIKPWKAGE